MKLTKRQRVLLGLREVELLAEARNYGEEDSAVNAFAVKLAAVRYAKVLEQVDRENAKRAKKK